MPGGDRLNVEKSSQISQLSPHSCACGCEAAGEHRAVPAEGKGTLLALRPEP